MAALGLLVDGVIAQRFELEAAQTTIGRARGNDIRIDDPTVSGRHARVDRIENPYLEGHYDYFLVDLDSTNGTFVNGAQVTRVKLRAHDEVGVGWNTFKFMDEAEPPPDRTAYIIPGRG